MAVEGFMAVTVIKVFQEDILVSLAKAIGNELTGILCKVLYLG